MNLQKKRMINALQGLKESFDYVNTTWDSYDKDFDFNDFLADNFPFNKSFDEVASEVYSWVEKSVENLSKGEEISENERKIFIERTKPNLKL